VTCFNCHQVGHKSFECLQQVQPGGQNRGSQFQTPAKPPTPGGQPPRTQQRTAQPPATRGRLNHLTAEDAAAALDVALGEFFVDSVLATVLFDTGAQFSYISTKFVKEMSLPTKPRPRPILTSSPLGEKRSTLECGRVKMVFEGQLFTVDLTVLESTGHRCDPRDGLVGKAQRDGFMQSQIHTARTPQWNESADRTSESEGCYDVMQHEWEGN
jgi:hypothetical protein